MHPPAPEDGCPLTFCKIFLNNLFCKVVHSACLVFPAKTITGQAEPVTGQPKPAVYTAVLISENGQKSRKTSPLHPIFWNRDVQRLCAVWSVVPRLHQHSPYTPHTLPLQDGSKVLFYGFVNKERQGYLGDVMVECWWSVGEVFKQHSTSSKPLYRKAFREIWVECGVLNEIRSTCAVGRCCGLKSQSSWVELLVHEEFTRFWVKQSTGIHNICIIYNGTCIVINIKYRVGQQTKLIVQLYLLSITRNYLFTTLRPLLMYSPLIYCLRNHPRIFK